MPNIQSTTTSSRNQTVVPKNVRKALNLRAGDMLYWHVTYRDKKPVIIVGQQPKSITEYARGLGKHLWDGINLTTYIDTLRNEWNQGK